MVVVITIAFCAPFYIYKRRSKQNKMKILNFFNQTVLDKEMEVSQFGFWRDRYLIGLDVRKRKLLYIDYAERPFETLVELDEVKAIELHERSHEVGFGSDKRKILDYLDLTFYFKGPQNSSVSLEFYDGEMYSDLEGEMPLCRKWLTILKPLISEKEKVEY